jgi:hypothetical protein
MPAEIALRHPHAKLVDVGLLRHSCAASACADEDVAVAGQQSVQVKLCPPEQVVQLARLRHAGPRSGAAIKCVAFDDEYFIEVGQERRRGGQARDAGAQNDRTVTVAITQRCHRRLDRPV